MLTAVALVRLIALNRLRSDCKGYFVLWCSHLSPLSHLRLLIDLQLHQRGMYVSERAFHFVIIDERVSESERLGPFFLQSLGHSYKNYASEEVLTDPL